MIQRERDRETTIDNTHLKHGLKINIDRRGKTHREIERERDRDTQGQTDR